MADYNRMAWGNHRPYPSYASTFDVLNVMTLLGGVVALVSVVITMVFLPAILFNTQSSWMFSPWVIFSIYTGAAAIYTLMAIFGYFQITEIRSNLTAAKLSVMSGLAMSKGMLYILFAVFWGVAAQFHNLGLDYLVGNTDAGILPDINMVILFAGLIWSSVILSTVIFVVQLFEYPALCVMERVKGVSIEVYAELQKTGANVATIL